MIDAGNSQQEVLTAKLTAPYDAWVAGGLDLTLGMTSADRFVGTLYGELAQPVKAALGTPASLLPLTSPSPVLAISFTESRPQTGTKGTHSCPLDRSVSVPRKNGHDRPTVIHCPIRA